MANPTTNYSFAMPTNTDLVKDLPADFDIFGQAVDDRIKALNPETTAGDISYRGSTANAKSRLAIGTAGQILTVNSGATAPEWATPTSGGMTLINTGGTTLSGASTTISSIPSTYINLEVVVLNYKPATDADYLIMRFNSNSTGVYFHGDTDGGTSNRNINGTSIRLTEPSDNSVANGMVHTIINQYASTASGKIGMLQGMTNNQTTTTNYNFYWTQWQFKDTTAISSITFLNDLGGNFTSGTAYIYGVR